MRILIVLLFGLVIATGGNVNAAKADNVYVGALVVERGPGLDQVTGGGHVGQSFMATWHAYQAGQVHGANAYARIFFSTNGRQQTLYNGGINGVIKLRTSSRHVQQATCLCVEVNGQQSCTAPGEAYRFVRNGGARSAADAWGVALMTY